MIVVGTILLIVGIAILIEVHLDTIRWDKRIERMKQRDADKLKVKRKEGRT